jgi:hypothetical protein
VSGEIEWVGSANDAVSAVSEDLAVPGRERRGPAGVALLARVSPPIRLLWRVAVLAVVAGTVAALLAAPATTSGHGSQAAVRPASHGQGGPPGSLLDGEQNVALVRATANDPAPLSDYVRPNSPHDGCVLVTPGHSPERAITAAVRTTLPGYLVRDVGRTLDEFTALCILAMRATDARGSTLVIQVVAPSPGARYPFTSLTVSTQVGVTTAGALTRAGWSVIVGATGPEADQPSIAALLSLAQDPALRW